MKNTAAGYNKTYTYTYDNNGNILSVNDGSTTTSYVYDSANQLTRENNQAAGKAWVYTYDKGGNITSKKEYAYTTGTLGSVQSTKNYTYGNTDWGDLLTAYNGSTVTSDTIGNMLSDGSRTFTWEHGRQLKTLAYGGTTWNFTYATNGLRTGRTGGSTTYGYVYNGSQLSQMTVGGNTLKFTYANGSPVSVTYNGTIYYYVTNLQGDVTAILNTSGTAVVNYTYDAWGNILSTTGSMASTLGVHNPLRYRGYVYDQEYGLYYLQSRYYNPAMGRFISADAFAATGQGLLGNNMFAYCNNNPIMYSDASGNWPELSTVFAAVAIIAIAVVAVVACAPAATAVIPALTSAGTLLSSSSVLAVTEGVETIAAVATAGYICAKKAEQKAQTYSVYFLQDSYGTVQYVGRVKSSGYSQRMAYHKATRNLDPLYFVDGLTYEEARGLEEIGMIECHTINKDNSINNQIHGISESNPRGPIYMNAAMRFLSNIVEDELLNILD